MRDTITMNSLPTEILERIIKCTSEDGNYWGESWRKYYLRECALVSRRWAVIANSLLWKEVSLYSYRNKKEFSLILLQAYYNSWLCLWKIYSKTHYRRAKVMANLYRKNS